MFTVILVQEMSKHIKLRKLIIVSSVKTKYELPKRFKILKVYRYSLAIPIFFPSTFFISHRGAQLQNTTHEAVCITYPNIFNLYTTYSGQ